MSSNNNEGIEERYFVVKKVYDPVLRILHWWNALSIFSLMLTIWLKKFIREYENGKEIIYRYHTLIGYALTAGITLRIIWGFIGPEHAKFKNMIHIKSFIKLIKTRKYDYHDNWGHDKYAGLLYIIIYLLMIYQIFSGLYLAAKIFGMGPLTSYVPLLKEKTPLSSFLKDVHEIIFYISMIFVLLHVFMIIFHEIKRKYPMAQSMFSGNQYRKK
jgi:cytochrome b